VAGTVLEAWLTQLLEDVLLDDVGAENYPLYSATNMPNKPLGASMGTGPGVKAVINNIDALSAGSKPHYDFFNGRQWQAVVRKSFATAVSKLLEKYGEDMASWRLKAEPMVWQPYNFRGVRQAADSKQALVSYLNRGSENNLFLATGSGFTAFDVIAPGQSGFVSSSDTRNSNFDDQMALFKHYKLKSLPFSRSAMEAIAVERKTLQY
jgi:penicillin amidase